MENIIIFTDKETGAQRRYIILPRSHKQEAGKKQNLNSGFIYSKSYVLSIKQWFLQDT